jgi:hypothetical protein
VSSRRYKSLSKASSKSYITKAILGKEEEEFNRMVMLPKCIGIQREVIGA